MMHSFGHTRRQDRDASPEIMRREKQPCRDIRSGYSAKSATNASDDIYFEDQWESSRVLPQIAASEAG